ncbi:hypothetical protein F544_11400 [Bibersteinia trehalosi USDA-ARS-USMARC-190]|uniref:Uncharacterized protein n=1 Tax=Bibersteinia trehalosi USDA-ARS-USMARC-190 TaxID=1263832 RepID=W0RAF5_BIBTR|nr:hypothetical protein F544_11400 [Bibersteinia trehalosi USDA-ARS-USMARC-190]
MNLLNGKNPNSPQAAQTRIFSYKFKVVQAIFRGNSASFTIFTKSILQNFC